MPPALPTQAASFLAAEHATTVVAGGVSSWSTLREDTVMGRRRHVSWELQLDRADDSCEPDGLSLCHTDTV